ncbi:MAG: hypothetical protein KY464_13555 [Gemmatimonadetes bacterium]|nr:hypothetical protein [Gemmatimonadota bacterium]
MLIPRYWSRAESQAVTPAGRPVRFHVWRGSRSSPAEAQSLAQEAVGRGAARIRAGEGFPERYTYGDRPLREEVVREFPAGASAGRATCLFVEELGSGVEHPDIAPLRALHDEQTRATSGLPLA